MYLLFCKLGLDRSDGNSMRIKRHTDTDVGCSGRYNDVGYAAKRMEEECSIIGLEGMERYTSTSVEACIRNYRRVSLSVTESKERKSKKSALPGDIPQRQCISSTHVKSRCLV